MLREAKARASRKRHQLRGVHWGGGWTGKAEGFFQGSEAIWCFIATAGRFAKTQRTSGPKVRPRSMKTENHVSASCGERPGRNAERGSSLCYRHETISWEGAGKGKRWPKSLEKEWNLEQMQKKTHVNTRAQWYRCSPRGYK